MTTTDTNTEVGTESVNLTPDTTQAIAPTEVLGAVEVAEIHCADCGNVVPRSGARGRPSKRCDACKEKVAAKVAKVTNCKDCQAVLPAPEGRGRPAHRCDACNLKLAQAKAEKAQKAAQKAVEALAKLVPVVVATEVPEAPAPVQRPARKRKGKVVEPIEVTTIVPMAPDAV